MSGRLKKLFHRGKHDDDDDGYEHEPEPRTSTSDAGRRSTSRRSVDVPSSPVQTSPYNAASPGRSPQVGGSPLHGQPMPLSPPHQSRDRRSSDVPRSPAMRSERASSLVAAATGIPTAPGQSRDLPRSAAPTPNNHTLELGPMDTDLSKDLQYLTLGGSDRSAALPTRHPYGGDVTRRNVPTGQQYQPIQDRDNVPTVPGTGQYSRGAAERDVEDNRYHPTQVNAAPAPYPRQGDTRGSTAGVPHVDGRPLHPQGPRPQSISRKPVDASPMSSSPVAPLASTSSSQRASVDLPSQTTSLNKPLPAAPVAEPVPQRAVVPEQGIRDPTYLVKDAAIVPHLKNVVNLTTSEDTDVHERWAPGELPL